MSLNKKQMGFSLLETCVALLILSILSVAALQWSLSSIDLQRMVIERIRELEHFEKLRVLIESTASEGMIWPGLSRVAKAENQESTHLWLRSFEEKYYFRPSKNSENYCLKLLSAESIGPPSNNRLFLSLTPSVEKMVSLDWKILNNTSRSDCPNGETVQILSSNDLETAFSSSNHGSPSQKRRKPILLPVDEAFYIYVDQSLTLRKKELLHRSSQPMLYQSYPFAAEAQKDELKLNLRSLEKRIRLSFLPKMSSLELYIRLGTLD